MNKDLENKFKEIEEQNIISNYRDTEIKVELLNEIIEDFVYKNLYEDGEYKDQRFQNLKQILSLYRTHEKNIPNFKYKQDLSPGESMKIAKMFLQELGPSYISCLEQCEKDGTLLLCTSDQAMAVGLDGYPTSFYYEGKNYINIILKYNICDVYSIIHETVHTTNSYHDEIQDNEPVIEDDEKFYTWDLFTETMSCLATNLARIYYTKKLPNKKELHKEYYAELVGHHFTSLQCDFMLSLLDIYLSNSQITLDDIDDLLANQDYNYIVSASEELTDCLDMGFFNLISELSYLLGNVVANYIISNYNYDEALNMFKDMNEMITYDKTVNIFKYLDLDAQELGKWFIDVKDEELAKLGGKNVKIRKNK